MARWVALSRSGALASVGLGGCGAEPPDAPTVTALADFSIQFSATPVHLATNVFAIQNGGSVGHEVIGLTGPERGMQGGGFGPDA